MFVKHYAPNYMLVHTKCQSWKGGITLTKSIWLFVNQVYYSLALISPPSLKALAQKVNKISWSQNKWTDNPKAICPSNFITARGTKSILLKFWQLLKKMSRFVTNYLIYPLKLKWHTVSKAVCCCFYFEGHWIYLIHCRLNRLPHTT